MDEVIASRPAAGHSYRNPVERCQCIANLGLQSVGMMRTKQSANFEHAMKKCDGNLDIRKECEINESFKKGFIESIKAPRELLEDVLGNLSLKDIPFSILQPATDEHIDSLEQTLSELDEGFPDMNSMIDIKKLEAVLDFYNKHCTSRTYFFQVRK